MAFVGLGRFGFLYPLVLTDLSVLPHKVLERKFASSFVIKC